VIRTEIIVKKAKALDLEKEIFNSRMAKPVLKSQIIWLHDKEVVELQIPETSTQNLKKFYEEQNQHQFRKNLFAFHKIFNIFVVLLRVSLTAFN
jgi:hypothetical protein